MFLIYSCKLINKYLKKQIITLLSFYPIFAFIGYLFITFADVIIGSLWSTPSPPPTD